MVLDMKYTSCSAKHIAFIVILWVVSFKVLSVPLSQYDYIYVIPLTCAQAYFGVQFNPVSDKKLILKIPDKAPIEITKQAGDSFIIYPLIRQDHKTFSQTQVIQYELIDGEDLFKLAFVFVDMRWGNKKSELITHVDSCWHGKTGDETKYGFFEVSHCDIWQKIHLQNLLTRRVNQALIDGISILGGGFDIQLANIACLQSYVHADNKVFNLACYSWGWLLYGDVNPDCQLTVSVLVVDAIKTALSKKVVYFQRMSARGIPKNHCHSDNLYSRLFQWNKTMSNNSRFVVTRRFVEQWQREMFED